ncbi:MAG: general secretion pathway protein GspK [Opitutales bacterium]|nr:general secretion pathway protein GspK [Opitutales bacterium]
MLQQDIRQLQMHARPTIGQRSGTVLVAVLLLVVLLSFIVVAFMEDATSRIKYYGLFHHQDDLRVDAYSALETSLAVINQFREIDGEIWGPAQGWSDPLEYAGFNTGNGTRINVRILDESGRLGLQSLDEFTLRLIFQELDFDIRESQELSDALLDWMDPSETRRLSGFGLSDYRNLDPPYSPANRPIRSWDELPLIHGFREAFWSEDGRPLSRLRQFREAISLYYNGPINLNAASPLVLRVLEAQGRLDRYIYENYRTGIGSGYRDTGIPRVIRDANEAGYLGEGDGEGGGPVGVTAGMLRVEVEAIRGEARFLISTLVSWSGSNPAGGSGQGNGNGSALAGAANLGYPFQIHALFENRKL